MVTPAQKSADEKTQEQKESWYKQMRSANGNWALFKTSDGIRTQDIQIQSPVEGGFYLFIFIGAGFVAGGIIDLLSIKPYDYYWYDEFWKGNMIEAAKAIYAQTGSPDLQKYILTKERQ